MACIEACGRGEMDVAVCLGGNLFGSNPDSAFASQALGQLDSIAYLSTSLNTGHAWGTARETLMLPVLPRDEEPQPTTQESMFSYVRLSDGGPARHAGPRSEVSVLAALARGVARRRRAGELGRPREPPADPRADRGGDPRPRADGRHRPHAPGIPHRRSPSRHHPLPDSRRARPGFRRSRCPPRCSRATAGCS